MNQIKIQDTDIIQHLYDNANYDAESCKVAACGAKADRFRNYDSTFINVLLTYGPHTKFTSNRALWKCYQICQKCKDILKY